MWTSSGAVSDFQMLTYKQMLDLGQVRGAEGFGIDGKQDTV